MLLRFFRKIVLKTIANQQNVNLQEWEFVLVIWDKVFKNEPKKKLWKAAFKTFYFVHSWILCPICLFSCIFRYLLLPWEIFCSHIDHKSNILENKKMKQQTSEPSFSLLGVIANIYTRCFTLRNTVSDEVI